MEQRFKRATVIGTGMMGPGIALTYAKAGMEVAITGRTPESVERGMNGFHANLKTLVANELLSAAEAEGIDARVHGSTDIFGEAARSDIVTESIAEDLKLKQQYFNKLDEICSPTVVLTSNTSGLRMTDIQTQMKRPERTMTTHFWNPPYLMPLVEVIPGERSDFALAQEVYDLLKSVGKAPVLLRKDVLGQLGNRLLHALSREAAYMVQQGICSAEDIDTAIKNGPGLRYPAYGALEHSDMVGLDLFTAIQTYLAPDLCNYPGALPILREKIASNNLGVKTGQGFYDWSKKDAAEVRRIRDEWIIWTLKARQQG